MIGQLRGQLILKKKDRIILDVQGVGYEVFVPLSSFRKLPQEGQSLKLSIYTYVREDQFQLYGFLEENEKELFHLLISVSGIGPRIALALLSEISPAELNQLILTKNTQRLTTISGVGKKLAERIVLELKEKIKKYSIASLRSDSPMTSSAFLDLASALVNLGYKQIEIDRVFSELSMSENTSFEDLFKKSLKILRS